MLPRGSWQGWDRRCDRARSLAAACSFECRDLIASAANSQNESIGTLNQQVRQYSVGVQVGIAIDAGDGIKASVARAEAEAARAAALLEGDRHHGAEDPVDH